MSQTTDLLAYLKRCGKRGATKAQIWNSCNIWNSGDCIMKLRNQGFNIETVMSENKNGKRFAIYYLRCKK